MLKKLFSILGIKLLLLLTGSSVFAQQTWSYTYDLSHGNEDGFHVIHSNHSLYVLAWGLCNQNNEDCHGLLKVSESGALIWKVLLDSSFAENTIKGMYLKNDTLFFNTNRLAPVSPHYAVLCYDTSGNYLGRWEYDQPGLDYYHWARDINGQGNQVYVSASYKTGPNVYSGILVVFDTQGNMLWRKDLPPPGNSLFGFSASAPSPDGGLGFVYSSGSWGARTAFIEKYSAQGDLHWRAQLPVMTKSSNYVTLMSYPGGGFVGSWRMDSSAWPIGVISNPDLMFKLDADGNFEWQKVDFTRREHYGNSFLAPDGVNIISAGEYFEPGTVSSLSGRIRCMSPQGEVLWRRDIAESRYGNAKFAYFVSGTVLPDHDMVFVGSFEDTTLTDNDPYPFNTWLVRLDSNGCIKPGCGEDIQVFTPVLEPPSSRDEQPELFAAFPNPCADHFFVAPRLGERIPAGEYSLLIYNPLGQMLRRVHVDPLLMQRIETAGLPAGLLHLQMMRDGKPVWNKVEYQISNK